MSGAAVSRLDLIRAGHTEVCDGTNQHHGGCPWVGLAKAAALAGQPADGGQG